MFFSRAFFGTLKWLGAESTEPFELRLPSVGFFGRVVVNLELLDVYEVAPMLWFLE